MSITSLLFLFLFLPASLGIYYIANEKQREWVLLGVSLLFYAIGSLKYFVVFLFAIVFTVAIGRSIHEVNSQIVKKLLLVIGIVGNVSILGYYKYTDFVIMTFKKIAEGGYEDYQLRNLILPLGISFFTFKAISYLVDVYKENIVLEEYCIHDALYLSFFGHISSGPLTRYNDFCFPAQLLGEKDARFRLFSQGVCRFMVGFSKKILLANVLVNITDEVYSTPMENYTVAFAWLGSICYSLQLYYDFSGYSDMAIGISNMFGYQCMENFNYPYMTESVSKFWRRWHISLSQWFRDYIYIPLGGSKNQSMLKVLRNMLVVWILTGIWHGASWTFVAWGLGYFVLITFEKMTGLPERFSTKIGKGLYRVATLIFINCQWILFRSPDIVTGLRFIKRLFVCGTNEITNMRTIFLLNDYLGFLVCAVLFAVPVIPWLEKKCQKNHVAAKIWDYGQVIVILLLFVWAISFVVSGQNNPFAYANF